jgi:hypothetical protein
LPISPFGGTIYARRGVRQKGENDLRSQRPMFFYFRRKQTNGTGNAQHLPGLPLRRSRSRLRSRLRGLSRDRDRERRRRSESIILMRPWWPLIVRLRIDLRRFEKRAGKKQSCCLGGGAPYS